MAFEKSAKNSLKVFCFRCHFPFFVFYTLKSLFVCKLEFELLLLLSYTIERSWTILYYERGYTYATTNSSGVADETARVYNQLSFIPLFLQFTISNKRANQSAYTQQEVSSFSSHG